MAAFPPDANAVTVAISAYAASGTAQREAMRARLIVLSLRQRRRFSRARPSGIGELTQQQGEVKDFRCKLG